MNRSIALAEAKELLSRVQEWGKNCADFQSSLLRIDIQRFLQDMEVMEEARHGL